MDGLIAILIVIGIIEALTSSGKKKKREARQRAQREAAARLNAIRSASKSGEQARVPYSREEPAARPREIQVSAAPTARDAAAPRTAQPQVVAHTPEHRPHPAAMRGGEGSVSTQGESAEEHVEHRRRIAAEEAERRQEREERRDRLESNRERLRAAVVMSEVLSKPVALRPRAGYHR